MDLFVQSFMLLDERFSQSNPMSSRVYFKGTVLPAVNSNGLPQIAFVVLNKATDIRVNHEYKRDSYPL